MTKDEANRIITEAMGKCWHEWSNRLIYITCEKCKLEKYNYLGRVVNDRPDFFTPDGFFVWFKVAHEDMDMWEEFLLESHIPGVFPEDWIGEEGTMAWAEFLKEREK
jgi:hypothetical protein